MNDLLIIKYLNGNTISDEEQSEIELWLKSEENKKAARKIYQKWEVSLLTNTNNDIDTKKAFINFTQKRDQQTKKTIGYFTKWMVAAIFVCGFSISFLLKYNSTAKHEQIEIFTTKSIKKVTLPDSSHIRLNQNSSLTYNSKLFNQKSNRRNIEFEGEAFFDITPNKNTPFEIQTKDALITVIGTKFYISTSNNEQTKVRVIEGKVKVEFLEQESSFIVEENQQITQQIKKVQPIDKNELFWDTKTLVFQNNDLGYVISKLGEKFNTDIQLLNKEIENCKLTANFTNEELSTILEIISTIHSLDITFLDDKITIDGEICE